MFKRLLLNHISTDNISSFFEKNIDVSVLRLDKIHPVISGNKWFKLRFYLEEAIASGKKNILTFGGAWSNHIAAVAEACRMNELNAIGIIRGERPPVLSPTLLAAQDAGMQLVFITRSDYQQKQIPDAYTGNDYYLIPEGGYGINGVKGAATILDHASKEFTHCCCAVGTGTMMAGLINSIHPLQHVIGVSVMKNNKDLDTDIRSLLKTEKTDLNNWELIHDYHGGGYAKTPTVQIDFMNEFFRRTGIPSDIVYTGKLFYAINELVQKDYFPEGSRLLLIHSGGLQGNASLSKGTLIF